MAPSMSSHGFGGTTRRRLLGRLAASGAGALNVLPAACAWRQTGSEAPQPTGERFSLRWLIPGWTAEVQNKLNNRLIPLFVARHPEVTGVTVESSAQNEIQFRAQLAAGTPPDAVLINFPHFSYAQSGALLDLNKHLPKDKTFKIDEMYPRIVDYYRLPALPKPGLWAFPENYATEALYFNRGLLAAQGIKPPRDDWTWDDLVANAQKVLRFGPDGTPDIWGVFVRLNRIDHILWDYGGGFISDDGARATIGQSGSIQALEYLSDLLNRYKLQPPTGNARQMFLGSSLAFQFTQEAAVQQYNSQAPQLDYDVALVPKGPRGRFNFLFMAGVGATAQTAHPAAAYELAKWFAADDQVIEELVWDASLAWTPTPKIARNEVFWKQRLTKPSQRQLFLENPKIGKVPFYLMPKGTELQTIVFPALQDVWAGKRTARDVALELQPKMEAILQQR